MNASESKAVVDTYKEIADIVSTFSVAYEGVDNNMNMIFRMPPGTALMSQDMAASFGRALYDKIEKLQSPDVLKILRESRGFQIRCR